MTEHAGTGVGAHPPEVVAVDNADDGLTKEQLEIRRLAERNAARAEADELVERLTRKRDKFKALTAGLDDSIKAAKAARKELG